MLGRLKDLARLSPVLLGVPALQGGEAAVTAAPVVYRELVALRAPAPLPSAYRLGVVELPPPPADVVAPELPLDNAAADASGCPVALRAVVVAEPRRESLAVLEAAGTSVVTGTGVEVVVGGASLTVVSIASDHVMLRRGGEVVRCGLAR